MIIENIQVLKEENEVLKDYIRDLKYDNNDLADLTAELENEIKSLKEKVFESSFLIDFVKDRRDHSQAIGDDKAFEIYKEILKHA